MLLILLEQIKKNTISNVQIKMVDFDTLFPDVRESEETLTKQCQAVMLRMLKIVDYLCDRHDIQYFLVGGSLLGAVRHKGFIPWDDDLDIGMTRDNYDKFVQVAAAELPNDMFFQTSQTDPTYPACDYVEARLRDKYSSYVSENNWSVTYHLGLHVDIFVYDRAFLPLNLSIISQNVLLKKVLKDNTKRANVLRMISKKFPFRFVYASSYLQNFGMWKFGSNYIKEDEISALTKVSFEDMKAYIPAGWNRCLKRQYGNYMQLPPIEKQKGHHAEFGVPNPFVPCRHPEVLNWKNRAMININP
jgi:lipopolysaccharide cholinephosphotransferase